MHPDPQPHQSTPATVPIFVAVSFNVPTSRDEVIAHTYGNENLPRAHSVAELFLNPFPDSDTRHKSWVKNLWRTTGRDVCDVRREAFAALTDYFVHFESGLELIDHSLHLSQPLVAEIGATVQENQLGDHPILSRLRARTIERLVGSGRPERSIASTASQTTLPVRRMLLEMTLNAFSVRVRSIVHDGRFVRRLEDLIRLVDGLRGSGEGSHVISRVVLDVFLKEGAERAVQEVDRQIDELELARHETVKNNAQGADRKSALRKSNAAKNNNRKIFSVKSLEKLCDDLHFVFAASKGNLQRCFRIVKQTY